MSRLPLAAVLVAACSPAAAPPVASAPPPATVALPTPCKTHHRDDPDAQNAKLAVSLVPDVPRVASGGTLGVSLVFTNNGHAALPLDVHPGCSQFDLGAYDARGTRKDYVTDGCGFGSGCGGSVLRIVLEPGGTIAKHLSFKARVVRVTPKTNCSDEDAGGLPPGKYALRATAHQKQWIGGGPASPGPSISTPIEVTR